MAFDFNGTTQFLGAAGDFYVAADRPVMIACVDTPAVSVGNLSLVSNGQGDTDGVGSVNSLYHGGAQALWYVDTAQGGGASPVLANEQHVTAAVEDVASRRSYYNGTFGVESTSSRTPSHSSPQSGIGAVYDLTPDSFWQGSISSVSIWKDHAGTQSELDSLNAGANPLTIARGKLAHHYPMRGDVASTAIDTVGGFHLGVPSAAPTKTDEVPLTRCGWAHG